MSLRDTCSMLDTGIHVCVMVISTRTYTSSHSIAIRLADGCVIRTLYYGVAGFYETEILAKQTWTGQSCRRSGYNPRSPVGY